MKIKDKEVEKKIEDKKDNFEFKPEILDFSIEAGNQKMQKLFNGDEIKFIVDDYEEQLRELFGIRNPSLAISPDFENRFSEYYLALEKKSPIWKLGKWIYYPWLSSIVHVLDDEDFQSVRMARNRNLINKEEQEKFYNSTIGVAGLSVGNSVILAMVLQGGAKNIKIADHDRLVLSNTNRIRTSVRNLGLPKTVMTARQIYEINPYANVEIFSEGLNPHNIEEFFEGLDVVIDEIDNLAVKYLIREQAKKQKIAVVMATDNGDNGVIDIERYDLDKNTQFFHGRMGDISYDLLKRLDKFGIGKMITKHVGPENVTERMQDSLLQMGKTIVSWPQLGGAALLNGSAVAYCVRKILNKEPLENNRALISLDEKLIPDYNSPKEIDKRKKIAENFKNMLKL